GPASESPFRATVVPVGRVSELPFSRFEVVILCNVDALADGASRDLDRFVRSGGGLMVVLGDRSDAAFLARQDWFPGRLGGLRSGAGTSGPPLSRPAPATFQGAVMGRFGGATTGQ